LQTAHPPVTDGSIGLNVFWWYITLLLLGLSLVLIITALTALRVRRVVRFALPMPPLAADRPPRCRVCGAELPPRGAVRRCDYCSADSIVMGTRFQREQAHIEGALSQLESQIGTTLKAREDAAGWTMAFALIFSVVGLLGAWVAPMFLGASVPWLLLIPLVLIPLSLLLFVGQTVLAPVPKIPNLTDARPGSEVRIKGTSYRVTDYLEQFANSEPFSSPMVQLSNGQTPELLLKGYFEKGESVLLVQPYDVKLTGEYGAKPYQGEELYTFKLLPGGQLSVPPGEMVHVAGKPFEFRLWLGKPTAGQQPYATARARGRTAPQDVVIVPA
jgi:hypothetical protein